MKNLNIKESSETKREASLNNLEIGFNFQAFIILLIRKDHQKNFKNGLLDFLKVKVLGLVVLIICQNLIVKSYTFQ